MLLRTSHQTRSTPLSVQMSLVEKEIYFDTIMCQNYESPWAIEVSLTIGTPLTYTWAFHNHGDLPSGQAL